MPTTSVCWPAPWMRGPRLCLLSPGSPLAPPRPACLLLTLAPKQEQALSLLGTVANVLARLPALEDASAYGALAALPGHPHLRERLLAKQLAALDGLIQQLQGYLGDMQVGA